MPIRVVAADPLNGKCREPNAPSAAFDGSEDHILGYDAALQQRPHVPDIPTAQAVRFLWCSAMAAARMFVQRLSRGAHHPDSPEPVRDDYPTCPTLSANLGVALLEGHRELP